MRTKFCVAFLLTAIAILQSGGTAAQAQGNNRTVAPVQNRFANTSGQYDTSDLPHVKIFSARRKLQIVNENPEITNCMDIPSMRPNMDGMQVPFAMPNGGGTAGGAGSGVPAGFYPAGSFPAGSFDNPMVQSSRDSLPKSRLGPSNINPAALRPQPLLPDGRSTGIHGRLAGAVPTPTGPSTIRIGHPVASAPHNADTSKPVLMYQQQPTASVANSATAHTKVTGVIRDILKKQK